MNELARPAQFESLGIRPEQLGMLATHLSVADQYVVPTELGSEATLNWLKTSLETHLDQADAEFLFDVALRNHSPQPLEYEEHGYDSCQSHRELSKVVSEAILVGGLAYEGQLLGLRPTLEDVQQRVASQLKLEPEELGQLVSIAAKHGSGQDFLFPGVTPSSPDVPSLEDMMYKTLSGRPQTSVRTLTGVGGLRSDQQWNHVTDLVTFAGLKVTEDKRYYPGLGVFFMLMTHNADELPALMALKTNHPKAYAKVAGLKQQLATTAPVDYEGVSILCSSYLAPWSEMKQMQAFPTNKAKNLSQDFHSPSHEFVVLRSLFQPGNPEAPHLMTGLDILQHALTRSWSFNSTIHLPWTAELADLSNSLIGRVTNRAGDSAIRYGVGHKGKSLELVEYSFGNERRFPAGVDGLTAAALKIYPESETFEGKHQTHILHERHPLWKKIEQTGFLNAAIEELANS